MLHLFSCITPCRGINTHVDALHAHEVQLRACDPGELSGGSTTRPIRLAGGLGDGVQELPAVANGSVGEASMRAVPGGVPGCIDG